MMLVPLTILALLLVGAILFWLRCGFGTF